MKTRFLLGVLLWTVYGIPPAHAQSLSDQVSWKLLFNQLFALEIRKEAMGQGGSTALAQQNIRNYTAYTPNSFNDTLWDVLKAETSSEAYARRQAIFDRPENYQLISQLDFQKSVPGPVQSIPAVSRYLRALEAQQNRPIPAEENFFNSPEASAFLEAITTLKGQSQGQKVALVLVPGYAAHTIKFPIFPEILGDMNRAKGREASRPILDEGNGLDIIYEKFTTYYAKTRGGPAGFDILIPAGWEMGNTVGFNAETSDLLATWIKGLPPAYAEHKLILLGYSKGAPIILEFLQRHPELKSRVIGLLSYGAVIQGTHIARTAGKQIRDVLGKRSIRELVDTMRAKGIEPSVDSVLPFLSAFDFGFAKVSTIRDIMSIYDIDSSKIDDQINRILEGRELSELLDGVDDLSPQTRTAWNLRYFDNNLLQPGTFVFNLSGITDISSFAARLAADNRRVRPSSLLTPKLKNDGKLDWKNLSLDAWFLYIASQAGFKLAPGGLYDTQVDLQHTKTPWLDKSPLRDSLTAEELAYLWNQPDIRSKMQTEGIQTLEQFSTTPRSQLLRPQTWSNIHAYDLGEFKGHHWSLFWQAFRAPADVSNDYAIWEFPRKAFMKALLQTVALYNLVNQNS